MEVIICKTKQEIDNLVSEEIIELIRNKPNCILGLATGSSPLGIYKKLSEIKDIDFSNVKSFNLDEYCNNLDLSQSYRFFMDDNLFNHININKENTHFPSENNLEFYDNMIDNAGGIDFQLLGIGGNGHIGFNEPNTPFDSKTHITKLDERTIKDNSRFFKSIEDVPTSAVSMGISTILKAKRIVLIASGINKAKAIYDTVNSFSTLIPASSLNLHDNVTIYVDEEAASLLTKKD